MKFEQRYTPQTETENLWHETYDKFNAEPRYPEPDAIRWIFGTFPRQNAANTHILDMGMGAGRHVIVMKREGYQVTGTDHAESAVRKAIKWAEEENMEIDFVQASADDHPFPDNHFEGVLSYGAIYFLNFERFQKSVDEIYRMLKPGGSTFVLIRNANDIRKEKGEQTGPHEYTIMQEEDGMPWNNEINMAQTLMPRDVVENCFQAFQNVIIEEDTKTLANGKYRQATFSIYATK